MITANATTPATSQTSASAAAMQYFYCRQCVRWGAPAAKIGAPTPAQKALTARIAARIAADLASTSPRKAMTVRIM